MNSPDYRLLFRTSPVPTLLLYPDPPRFTIADVNDAYLEATQSRRVDLLGRGIFEAFPDNPNQPESDGVEKLNESLKWVVSHGESHVMGLQRYDIPDRRGDGSFTKTWWEPQNTPVYDDEGSLSYIFHMVRKVEDQDRIQARHLQKLEQLERAILEQYERDEVDLQNLLTAYMSGIEELHPGMYTSIMELRGGRLHPWAAPSLPDSFQELLRDLEPGPNHGSCGAAAWHKEKVITEDIHQDPRWEIYWEQIADYPFTSCWSWPILSNNGTVMATLAMYFERSNVPDPLESLTLDRTTQLLQIILDNHRKEEELRLTNERYHYINLASNESIYDWDIVHDELSWGESYYREYADPIETSTAPLQQWTNHIHPDQQEEILADLQQVLENPEQSVWRASYRFRKRNGQYAQIEEQGYIVRDTLGQAVRMIGAMRDITEKSELERLVKRTQHLARIGSWEADLINDSVYISDSAREMFALPPQQEVTLENALSFYDVSEQKKLDSAFTRCVRQGIPFDLEVKAVVRGGTERWIRVLGEADRVEGRTIRVYGSFQDVTDARDRQDQLLDSLREKETLLAEIHHRVKNNLAVVSAMMELQAATITHTELLDLLQSSVVRIKTMANIHEHLYRSKSFSDVDFSTSLKQLVNDILNSFDTVRPVHRQYQCEPLNLAIHQAIPCSLIVNEVVTNIVKHAFPNGEGGRSGRPESTVEIHLDHEDDQVQLEIRDNGIGIPDEIRPEEQETLGMNLIHQLTWQLDGRYELGCCPEGPGTRFQLTFQRAEPQHPTQRTSWS